MRFRWRGALLVCVSLACVAPPSHVWAADLLPDAESAYRLRALRRTPFEARVVPKLAEPEGRFLAGLFALTDRAVLLNTDAGRWLASDGVRGLHAADYLERMDALLEELSQLEVPARVAPVRELVAQALSLQRGFVAEWHGALEAGRPFASQLTDEYAWHEGLAQSQRTLVRAYVELRSLFPGAGEQTHTAFLDHLRAVSFR